MSSFINLILINMKKIIIGIIVVLVLVLVYISQSNKPEVKDTSDEVMTIGALLSLSGPASFIGESDLAGINTALAVINDDGGINGKDLRAVVEDSKTDPKQGVAAMNKLVSVDKVPAMFVSLSSIASAVRPIAESEKTVILVESSHPTIYEGHDYTFRNFWSNKEANERIVEYAKNNNMKNIAILHFNDEFGTSGADYMEELAKSGDINVVARESFAPNATDMRTQIAKIKESSPDLVYLIGVGPAMSTSYNQLRELGVEAEYAGFIICGQDDVMKNANVSVEGTLSVEPKIDRKGDEYLELESKLAELYPDKSVNQSILVSYDSVKFIAEALQNGAKTGEGIREYILEKKEFDGASGLVRFREDGESLREMVVQRIENNSCKTI